MSSIHLTPFTSHAPNGHEELFAKKEERRRELAEMPIEEKLQAVVKLQQIATTIGRNVGRDTRKPWVIRERVNQKQ